MKWRNEEGLPVTPHPSGIGDSVDSRELLDWWASRELKKAGAFGLADDAQEGGILTYDQEQLRLTRAKADLTEVQAAEAAAKVAPLADFEQVARGILIAIRQGLMSADGRLVAELAATNKSLEIRRIWRDEMRRILISAEAKITDYCEGLAKDETNEQ